MQGPIHLPGASASASARHYDRADPCHYRPARDQLERVLGINWNPWLGITRCAHSPVRHRVELAPSQTAQLFPATAPCLSRRSASATPFFAFGSFRFRNIATYRFYAGVLAVAPFLGSGKSPS